VPRKAACMQRSKYTDRQRQADRRQHARLLGYPWSRANRSILIMYAITCTGGAGGSTCKTERRRVEAQKGGVGRGLHTHARTRTHTRSHIYIHTHMHTMAASRRRTEEALSQKGGRQNMYYKKTGNERSEPRDNPEVVAQFTCFNGIKVQILTPDELQETLQAAVTRLDSVRGYQDEELIKVHVCFCLLFFFAHQGMRLLRK